MRSVLIAFVVLLIADVAIGSDFEQGMNRGSVALKLINLKWTLGSQTLYAPDLVVIAENSSEQVVRVHFSPHLTSCEGESLSFGKIALMNAVAMAGKQWDSEKLQPGEWTARVMPLGVHVKPGTRPDPGSKCKASMEVRVTSPTSHDKAERFSIEVDAPVPCEEGKGNECSSIQNADAQE